MAIVYECTAARPHYPWTMIELEAGAMGLLSGAQSCACLPNTTRILTNAIQSAMIVVVIFRWLMQVHTSSLHDEMVK